MSQESPASPMRTNSSERTGSLLPQERLWPLQTAAPSCSPERAGGPHPDASPSPPLSPVPPAVSSLLPPPRGLLLAGELHSSLRVLSGSPAAGGHPDVDSECDALTEQPLKTSCSCLGRSQRRSRLLCPFRLQETQFCEKETGYRVPPSNDSGHSPSGGDPMGNPRTFLGDRAASADPGHHPHCDPRRRPGGRVTGLVPQRPWSPPQPRGLSTFTAVTPPPVKVPERILSCFFSF